MEQENYTRLQTKVNQILEKWEEITHAIADPQLPSNPSRYKQVMQEHNYLSALKDAYDNYENTCRAYEEAQSLLNTEDDEMRIMAKEEMESLEPTLEKKYEKLRTLAIPHSPLDGKNIIMEIRAGTGGEEAALFAADLFRMYSRFAETQKWKIEVIDVNETEIGGYKEIIFSIGGASYGILKFESGVHRVQRVPTTESGGRLHTSAVTVAVLPEADETEIEMKTEDLRIEVFRSSGPGGQSVNTTDSAVRITHVPSGLTVSCQDEKSQHKNKAKALRILRARLVAAEEEKRDAERAQERKSQIGSGDRSERIRTYNYPQNRVSDHRIQLTLYQLDRILIGEMDELLSQVCIGLNE